MNAVWMTLGGAGAFAAAVAAVVVAMRFGRAGEAGRARLLWLAWAIVVVVTVAALGVVAHLLVDWPDVWYVGFAAAILLFPLAVALGRVQALNARVRAVLVGTIVNAGLVLLVAAVYLTAVIGLGRTPEPGERTLLWLSVVAAAVAAMLAVPARRRLEETANLRVYGERHSPDEALRTFGGRMSRSVPMDELLLQLAEILRKTMRLDSAEIYTGGPTRGASRFGLAVAVPSRAAPELVLEGEVLAVAARARAQGNAWLQLWIPQLLHGREDRLVRCVMVAHLGELLGMVVVTRRSGHEPFSDDEDNTLVDLARQVGLALHNVSLDSALQASLEELQQRNAELVRSRQRIVAAADESRRQIERNLHDGAQQHLVALAVKVGLVKTLLTADPDKGAEILDGLRGDVQEALHELRELAHGIYPPLLRDRGLIEALRTVANRASLPTTVIGEAGRYEPDVEAALYFCCVEAVQNAGKYAGDGATCTISIGNSDGTLCFEVADDGAGFDVAGVERGHGFVNMTDRLGAFAGRLDVHSSPGHGTTVRGEVPVASST